MAAQSQARKTMSFSGCIDLPSFLTSVLLVLAVVRPGTTSTLLSSSLCGGVAMKSFSLIKFLVSSFSMVLPVPKV